VQKLPTSTLVRRFAATWLLKWSLWGATVANNRKLVNRNTYYW
jgi:hypothetical protein